MWHGFARYLWLRVSHKLHSMYRVPHRKSERPSSLIRCWTDSTPCGLLDWGFGVSWAISWRPPLEFLHVSFSIGHLTTWQLASLEKANKKAREITGEKNEDCSLLQPNHGAIALRFCHVMFLRRKSSVQPAVERIGWHTGLNTRKGESLGDLPEAAYPPQPNYSSSLSLPTIWEL